MYQYTKLNVTLQIMTAMICYYTSVLELKTGDWKFILMSEKVKNVWTITRYTWKAMIFLMFHKSNMTARCVQKLTRKISLETTLLKNWHIIAQTIWQIPGWLNTGHSQFSSSESLSDGGSKPVRRVTWMFRLMLRAGKNTPWRFLNTIGPWGNPSTK